MGKTLDNSIDRLINELINLKERRREAMIKANERADRLDNSSSEWISAMNDYLVEVDTNSELMKFIDKTWNSICN